MTPSVGPRGLMPARRGLRDAMAWLRLSRSDWVITLMVVLWALAEAVWIESEYALGFRVVFALAVSLPVALRNRLPRTLLAFAFAAFAFDSIFQVLPLFAVTPLQLLPVAAYAAAARGVGAGDPLRYAALCTVVPITLMVTLVDGMPSTASDVIGVVVVQLAAVAAGRAVHQGRLDAALHAKQLRELESSARTRVEAGIDAERLRLARELRVIVARALDGMGQLLTGIEDASPALLRSIARTIQQSAAHAMDELQLLLGALHGGRGLVTPSTVQSAAGAADQRGWSVALDVVGESTSGVQLAAGRVVEELLAGRPAGDPAVQVCAEGTASGVRLTIRGGGLRPHTLRDPAACGSLRERIRLHGGSFRTRNSRARWRVDVVLPATGAEIVFDRSALGGDLLVAGTAALVIADDAVDSPIPVAMAAIGVAAFIVPLLLRRQMPLLAPFSIGAGLLAIEAAGLSPEIARAPFIMALLGACSASMYVPDERSAVLASVGVAVPALTVNLLHQQGGPLTDTAIIAFLVVTAHAFGRLLRKQLERASGAVRGEATVSAVLDERLRSAIDAERRSVARDLHDVVAHGVSLIGVLAGAADAQAERDPERSRASLMAASAPLAQARVELERLTYALAAPGTPEPATSGLDELAQLVEATRRTGQDITLEFRCEGTKTLQRGVATSVYRIAQEALTNARKHAPGARVDIEVVRRDGLLTVEVVNEAPPGSCRGAGTGHGLIGMRERARLLGGDLVAESTAAGGFRVAARLPLSADAP